MATNGSPLLIILPGSSSQACARHDPPAYWSVHGSNELDTSDVDDGTRGSAAADSSIWRRKLRMDKHIQCPLQTTSINRQQTNIHAHYLAPEVIRNTAHGTL
jgi:hypothetical protein